MEQQGSSSGWGLLADCGKPQHYPGQEAAEPDRLLSLPSKETGGAWYLAEGRVERADTFQEEYKKPLSVPILRPGLNLYYHLPSVLSNDGELRKVLLYR